MPRRVFRLPAARTPSRNARLAHDAAILLRGETPGSLSEYTAPTNSRILDAAGVISPHQAVLGNPIPLAMEILDDVKPGINVGAHGRNTALIAVRLPVNEQEIIASRPFRNRDRSLLLLLFTIRLSNQAG
jgi:hypothetical protein